MGIGTRIEWADHTWNPFAGCTRVSEGCQHCYARRHWDMLGLETGTVRATSPATWNQPLARDLEGNFKVEVGGFVFVCSISDFFHEDIPDASRDAAMAIMGRRPDLTFLLLTKRPGTMKRWVEGIPGLCGGDTRLGASNVWLGVTAENQKRFDERVPILVSTDWPGRKFVSVEPMLGPIDMEVEWGQGPGDLVLDTEIGGSHLDWIICGGESGRQGRPMNPAWARKIRDQCTCAGVPFFFKQWGKWGPESTLPFRTWGIWDAEGNWLSETAAWNGRVAEEPAMYKRVKAVNGRLLDGVEHSGRPERVTA